MTTREFEDSLTRAGVPAESVRELTRLFEAVRYGWSSPGPEEGERAIRCLEAIVGSCRDAAAAPAAGTGTRE